MSIKRLVEVRQLRIHERKPVLPYLTYSLYARTTSPSIVPVPDLKALNAPVAPRCPLAPLVVNNAKLTSVASVLYPLTLLNLASLSLRATRGNPCSTMLRYSSSAKICCRCTVHLELEIPMVSSVLSFKSDRTGRSSVNRLPPLQSL